MDSQQSDDYGTQQQPDSPRASRRPYHRHHSTAEPSELSPLLNTSRSRIRIDNGGRSPRPIGRLSRHQSQTGSLRGTRHHSRQPSWGQRLVSALGEGRSSLAESKSSIFPEERVWYDQFTSTDWVHDTIADSHRVKALRARKDVRGRILNALDGAQGWFLSALCGVIIALIAYAVDVTESTVFDFKDGFCARAWYLDEKKCCPKGACEDWKSWSQAFRIHSLAAHWTDYLVYLFLVIALATFSCWIALWTRTVVASSYQLTTLDENLAAEQLPQPATDLGTDDSSSPAPEEDVPEANPPMIYYAAAGSGVAEVRVILSGFVLHGFLGLKTLVIKMVALVFSVASGLSLGKEGPYVHMAACVGNIACRLFSKYDRNDAKRREVLSAAAAAGVAVAFGAPLGGVLFGLEEVSYFFPAKTLFRTFFCCIVAALSLKFLNPYGTHKIVMFQVRYLVDWEFFELGSFFLVGILGGALGALFIKASKYWAHTFRRLQVIKRYPMFEVFLVALMTGLLSYWNALTKLPVAKLLLNLASPCDDSTDANRDELGLCPNSVDDIPGILKTLVVAFLIKGFLTVITFGIKVPAGIYIPSMVVGGLMGRMVGHLVQWLVLAAPDWRIWGNCATEADGTCIQPGVYGLIAAGATMCGVTRLSVTLAVILFELTGSLDYVLPFSLTILVAKWTADAIEPNSIYDLLTSMNAYPFLDNKHKPVFTGDLADIITRFRRERVIDITNSPLVAATKLRSKLEILHRAGELDGGLPILRHDILVGLIPAPDLEFALDQLEEEATSLCLMDRVPSMDEDEDDTVDPTDFTPYIDPAPVALDLRSPTDLVYECFVKLGLRYICATKDGRYAGMIHKKTFVRTLQYTFFLVHSSCMKTAKPRLSAPLPQHSPPWLIPSSNSPSSRATHTHTICHALHRRHPAPLVPVPAPIPWLPSSRKPFCPPRPLPFSLHKTSHSTMSTAPLKSTEVATGDDLAKQIAEIIDTQVKDAASLTKATSAQDTANKIDQLFQNTLAANSDGAEDFLYTFWDVTLKAVATIPATDQRLHQLITVIQALQKKDTAQVEIWGAKTSVWKDLPMLGPALRDAWNFKPELDGKEDHAAVQKWISLNSFAARILGQRIQSSFNLGLWELRAGLEEKHPSEASRDLHLNTASEWLWHAGDELHRLSTAANTLNQQELDITKTGSLVEVPGKGPSKDRWVFWKKRLGELSSELSCAAKEEGLKERVDGVVKKMSTLEKGGK